MQYELIPGTAGWAWETNVVINTHGFRGPEPTPGRYPGFRILFLGDSITFGNFLDLEATFAHQLMQRLLLEAKDFDVLNFGVGGYDTLQEVALLEDRGLNYYPDLVVVTYCLNDAGIASANLQFIEKLQTRQQNPLFRLRLVQFVAERLDRIKHKRWQNHKNDPAVFRREYAQQIETIGDDETELLELMKSVPASHPSEWYGDRDRIGRLRFSFQWLSQLSRQQGFSVLVMIIPWLTGDPETYPHATAHRIVELEARRVGFDILDLTQPFMRAGAENLRRKPGDLVHPNEAGQAIIAEEVSRYVRAQAKKHSAL